MTDIPQVTLHNGLRMPQLGLGTYRMEDGEETVQAVHAALEAGYRLIDTAKLYGNERSVGEAVRTSGVPREEIFVTTKLWNGDQGYSNALAAIDESLDRLDLEYVDLYLIHWPLPELGLYVESWKALEEIYESGRAKAIGVCNFSVAHLEKVLQDAVVVPMVNQVELHPHLPQREIREFCESKSIVVESWRPIGGVHGDLRENDTITGIADKHNRTPAQILLRWHVQLGLVPIPKSSNLGRIRENADIFGFELDNDDMAKISALDTGTRYGPDPEMMNRR